MYGLFCLPVKQVVNVFFEIAKEINGLTQAGYLEPMIMLLEILLLYLLQVR